MDIGSAADSSAEREDKTDDQGNGGQHFEVDHGLESDSPHLLQVASATDATDHDAENNQADEHFDQLDKAVAQGFEVGRVFGKGQATDDAQEEAEYNLKED